MPSGVAQTRESAGLPPRSRAASCSQLASVFLSNPVTFLADPLNPFQYNGAFCAPSMRGGPGLLEKVPISPRGQVLSRFPLVLLLLAILAFGTARPAQAEDPAACLAAAK